MLVRPGVHGGRAERPASVPGFGSARSWKHEREVAMMRVEAQRNSLVLSSDEEAESKLVFRLEAVQQNALPRTQNESMQQQSFNPLSVADLCNIPEMREPFPAELDFAQITNKSDYDPRVPPPPPPRPVPTTRHFHPFSHPACALVAPGLVGRPACMQPTSSFCPSPAANLSRPCDGGLSPCSQ